MLAEVYCTVVEMVRKAKHPRQVRSWRFTLVRDTQLRKVDSNTRKIHSQLMLCVCHICISVVTPTLAKANCYLVIAQYMMLTDFSSD